MDKLKLIIYREFWAKVSNKSFLVMTFLSPLLMIGMLGLIYFLTIKNDEKIKNIAYVDESGLFAHQFEDTSTIKYTDQTTLGIDEVKKEVEADDYQGVLYIPKKNDLKILANSLEFYSVDTPGMSIINNLEQTIETRMRNIKLTEFDININKIKASKIDANIKMYDFSGEESSKLINGLKIGVGTVAGYLIMMFVMIYGNSVMRSVIEEKTTRIIEIIVSSVKPFQLMLGKIIGNATAGLLQFLIWGIILLVLTSVITAVFDIDMSQTAATMRPSVNTPMNEEMLTVIKEILKLPLLKIFVLFLFYFFGGFMLYSSFFAAIGAAVNNETDTQQFMLPIMMPLMLAVYVGFTTVISDPHGPISIIFSVIPLTSPIVMLMRIPFGVSWIELLVSMVLLLLTFLFVVWVAAKIYRIGILMYGKKPTYRDLYKWLFVKQ